MVDDPLLSRELSQACLDLLDRGVVPPLPVTVFPYGDYAKALRLMTSRPAPGQAGAAGAAGGRNAPDFPIDDRRPLLDPDATYLVTGGLGGFGQRLLPYLVDRRRPPPHPDGPRPRAPPQRDIGCVTVHDACGRRRRGSRSIWSGATWRRRRTCAAASPT